MANDQSILDLALNDATLQSNATAGSGWMDSTFDDFDSGYDPFAKLDTGFDADRAAELKKKELFRKGKLQYEDDGSLINDSNTMIRAKEVANAGIQGVDWLLEASENIADFGQGDLIDSHNDLIDAEINGKKYNMSNKDILGARELGPNANAILQQEYMNAENDPMAKGGVYTLKKFDGYNPDGSTKYIYKYGYAHDGAIERYKNQWVQDGFEIVDEKKFVGAENWENKWHAAQGSLDNRVLDSGVVYDDNGNYANRDKASGINFGSGSSELYNSDILGTDVGKTQADYDRNKLKSQAMQNAFKQRPWDSNWVDAAQSSTVAMVADLGDFILDAVTPGNNTLLDDWSDSEYTDKVFGFDSVGQSQLLHEALNDFKNGNIVSAGINTAIAAPGLLGQSLPYLIGLSTGTTEAKLAVGVAKAAQKIKKAKDLGKGAEEIAQLTNRMKNMKGYTKYKSYEDMPVNLAHAKSILTDKGLMATHTSMVEEQLDQRVKNKLEAGEDPNLSVAETSAVWLGMLPFTLLDKVAFLDTVKSGGFNKVVKEAYETAPDYIKNNILTKATANVGKILASGSEEAAQEYAQTWGEIFGANLGVGEKGFGDVLSDSKLQDEALMGAIGGLGAGSLTNAIVSTPKLAGGAVKGLIEARSHNKDVKNLEAIVSNLDDTDFNLLIQDMEDVVTTNNEVVNNIEHIKALVSKAKDIDTFINSPIENVREFGKKIRDIARGIALQDETFDKVAGEEIGNNLSSLELFDSKGNLSTSARPEIYTILGIDPNEESYSAGTNVERRARNTKIISQAYAGLSNEEKFNLHKIDSLNDGKDPVLVMANIFNEGNLDIVKKAEESAFNEKGIVDTELNIRKKDSDIAKQVIEKQKDRISNYKEAREEAIATGSGKTKFNEANIKLDEYEKDPKGFVETIKSFGRKSKIVEKIKGYSDESLIKAANDKLASKSMKAAIKHVLDTRNNVKTKATQIEKEYNSYESQIDNLETRYTKEAIDNIEKILSEKTYEYAEERDDAIRFVNEAYAKGKINNEKRNELILDIGFKSIGTSEVGDKNFIKNKADKARMNRDLKAIDKEDISEKEKTIKRNEVVKKYSGSLNEAGEKDLGKTKQIEKYNAKTFTSIRKLAARKEIVYTQERDRAFRMIDAALNSGHISKKQADTFKARIEKISANAEPNPDLKVYEELKPNIIKTAADIEEEFSKLRAENEAHEETIFNIEIKDIMGEEVTKEDEEAYVNAKRRMEELAEISKEYIYFTQQEKELNNVIDQFWTIEVDEMTDEEARKDRKEHQILFTFC